MQQGMRQGMQQGMRPVAIVLEEGYADSHDLDTHLEKSNHTFGSVRVLCGGAPLASKKKMTEHRKLMLSRIRSTVSSLLGLKRIKPRGASWATDIRTNPLQTSRIWGIDVKAHAERIEENDKVHHAPEPAQACRSYRANTGYVRRVLPCCACCAALRVTVASLRAWAGEPWAGDHAVADVLESHRAKLLRQLT